ncbi:hypothetical protein C2W62_07525 [Candidatus Entotheonella serta]|nr:hypothetical protein C2W62_07525 [Candidatus Entotheonella serta]
MNEQAVVTAIETVAETLGTMALVLIHPEDPLALPEPPGTDVIAAYNGQLDAIKAEVGSNHNLLEMSKRDFGAGYPDRAGAYLVEFLEKLMDDSDYNSNFSEASRDKLDFSLRDLREL